MTTGMPARAASATSPAPAALMSATATRSPAAANAAQIALPMPLAPPVTRTTRSPAVIRAPRRPLQLLSAVAAERHLLGQAARPARRTRARRRAPDRFRRLAVARPRPQRPVVDRPLVDERRHAFPRLAGGEVQAQPVPGMARGQVPEIGRAHVELQS